MQLLRVLPVSVRLFVSAFVLLIAVLAPTARGAGAIPQPVTGHPRLWITPTDLPRLRGWAVPGNPIYQDGLVPLLSQVVSDYQTQFFPGGTGSPSDIPNPTYPDIGDTQGYTGLLTEAEALVFAFHSLIDPDPQARILHAQRARNLIMYALNRAALGPLSDTPFRDPMFAIYNRGSGFETWPLVVDWIYGATDSQGHTILTAADKATIRKVFLRWADECLHASTTYGDNPYSTVPGGEFGATNSLSLLPDGNAYRMASNNYYLAHARLVTMMALCIDPADDPAVDPARDLSVLGNSLRSYIANASGAWLYQEYAMLGEPEAVRRDYGLAAAASVGLSSGGLPPEGMLYGESYAYLFGQLLALKTAGFATLALSGPQAALVNNAPVWDRFTKGMLASLVPAAQVFPEASYMGPVYQMACYGDILRTWVTPGYVQPFALQALLDQRNGDTSRLNAQRWLAINAIEGGAERLIDRVRNPWSYGVQSALLYFLLLDPAAPAATDPRPGFPTAFYDSMQGRLVEHSDWSPTARMFDFRCSWISINHQQSDAGMFDFYRKGEWLAKGLSNYDSNGLGQMSTYLNTLSLKNACTAGTPNNIPWYETAYWPSGSQWQLAESAGDPSASVGVGAGYTYVFGEFTNLYNRPSEWTPENAMADILHASRSIVWLKPDHLVVYDRAVSRSAGLFKRWNLGLTAAPVIAGTLTTSTTPGGQRLFIRTLLPAAPTISSVPVGPEISTIAELDPTNHRIVVEDTSLPSDVRFLHVLQGADAGTAADSATLVRNTAGTAYEGAVVRNCAVLFKRDVGTPFALLGYTVPATTTDHYVTGLTPGAGYTVATTTAAGSIQVVVTPGGSRLADSAGVLHVAAGLAGYASWSLQIPDALQRGAWSDYDHDGMANAIEYVLGRSPVLPDIASPVATVSSILGLGNYLTITFPYNESSSAEFDCAVQASADLINWTTIWTWDVATPPATEVSRTGGPVRTIVVRDVAPAAAASRSFLRLRVTARP